MCAVILKLPLMSGHSLFLPMGSRTNCLFSVVFRGTLSTSGILVSDRPDYNARVARGPAPRDDQNRRKQKCLPDVAARRLNGVIRPTRHTCIPFQAKHSSKPPWRGHRWVARSFARSLDMVDCMVGPHPCPGLAGGRGASGRHNVAS